LWDECQILQLIKINKTYLEVYYKFDYLHQKIDFARYIILYKYGGIYLDIDTYAIKSLDYILDTNKDYEMIVSKINLYKIETLIRYKSMYLINNGIIIAKPNVQIMKDIIDYVTNNYACGPFTHKMACIQKTTGPSMFTFMITNYKYKNRIKILDYEYLEPCVMDVCNITDKTHIVHRHAGSWHTPYVRTVGMFYLTNKKYIWFGFTLFLVFLLYKSYRLFS
jgi:mannosyltransferase OCH1-like enzyme